MRFRAFRLMFALSVSALVTLAAASLEAQEPKKETSLEDTIALPTVQRRVPSYFGQIEITPEQREKIYAIQAAQQPEIDRLKQQGEMARAKLLKDCEKVLSEKQQQKLTQLRSEAKAKSLARTKSRAKAKEAADAALLKPAIDARKKKQ
jgi:Spy/CpxP family protein refolding chaperone